MCDFIDVEPSVRLEFITPTPLTFSVGELPPEVQHQPKLLITAYGDTNGLHYWVAPPGVGEARRCGSSTEPRSKERFCSRLSITAAHSSDSLWLRGEASGEYDLELALLDFRPESKLDVEPVCTRTVRVEVTPW